MNEIRRNNKNWSQSWETFVCFIQTITREWVCVTYLLAVTSGASRVFHCLSAGGGAVLCLVFISGWQRWQVFTQSVRKQFSLTHTLTYTPHTLSSLLASQITLTVVSPERSWTDQRSNWFFLKKKKKSFTFDQLRTVNKINDSFIIHCGLFKICWTQRLKNVFFSWFLCTEGFEFLHFTWVLTINLQLGLYSCCHWCLWTFFVCNNVINPQHFAKQTLPYTHTHIHTSIPQALRWKPKIFM